MLQLFALAAYAAPMEAVVFPGSGVDRSGVETRLAALRALSPPPVRVATIGPRLRIEVATAQVAALTEAGWVPAAEHKVRDVAQAEAAVWAAWAALPTATLLVELVEDDVTDPIQLRSEEEGIVLAPGQVPAGTYQVIIGDKVLQTFHAEAGAVLRIHCSVVFRNCLIKD